MPIFQDDRLKRIFYTPYEDPAKGKQAEKGGSLEEGRRVETDDSHSKQGDAGEAGVATTSPPPSKQIFYKLRGTGYRF